MTALLDKRETRIRRMFGQIAPWYDRLNHLLSLNVDTWWRQRTTQLAPPPTDGPILDLCTGTGDLAFAYDRAASGRAAIIGADFCHEMLTLAVHKSRQRATTDRIRFLEADAQQLPFPDNTFALTTVAFGLRNVTDTNRGLSEMVRVTAPGGRVAILEFSRPRLPIFRFLYRGYFQFLLPLIGQFFSRSKESAYRYLPASVLTFPDYEALTDLLTTHGLIDVAYYPLTFGIATLYVGTKRPVPTQFSS